MSKAYRPHTSVESYRKFTSSGVYSSLWAKARSGEIYTLEDLRHYLEANEANAAKGGPFWSHEWRTLLAALRWDYERQKEAADDAV